MNTQEYIDKINIALQTIAMPDEVRMLLVELRDDLPLAKTEQEQLEIFRRWGTIALTAGKFLYDILENQ